MPDTGSTGHRQRLRDRFASGDQSFRSEGSLLELLLTYTIPQKDVRPLAKHLLSEYGSLSSLRATLHCSAEQTRHRYAHDFLHTNLMAKHSLGEIWE
ncbi:MAG: hypothetical protein F9K13_07100 [Candidatus Methylomirabilis oxygeniifera]|uniref:DNA repair protein RadC n=1 Tax=Methylomirabilis oxygeniifera TaxID=671143 RepID=D5MH33_METO1|nr:MAG: hypothetical protein F9K13_07100 [Candidatus Methylomirabilis oxyfera]CBE69064.1 protein of unknown function [Candidatus Methylomirabilis oxyfera]